MSARIPFGAFRREGLSSTPGGEGPEAATQTYLHGAVLIYDAGGDLAEAGVNPSLLTIVGIATGPGKNGTADGDKRATFTPRERGVVFMGSVGNAAVESADTAVSAAVDLTTPYGITEGSAGDWFIDKTKTAANSRVIVTEFVDPVGTLRGRVGFKFLDTAPA